MHRSPLGSATSRAIEAGINIARPASGCSLMRGSGVPPLKMEKKP